MGRSKSRSLSTARSAARASAQQVSGGPGSSSAIGAITARPRPAASRRSDHFKVSLTTSGARWCLGRGLHLDSSFKLEARSLREAVMPDVLRQNAPPVANDFLRSADLSPDEIDLVRNLVGHTIAAVECGLICETLAWRGGNRTHAANVLGISVRGLRNKIHLYECMGVSLCVPNRGLICAYC